MHCESMGGHSGIAERAAFECSIGTEWYPVLKGAGLRHTASGAHWSSFSQRLACAARPGRWEAEECIARWQSSACCSRVPRAVVSSGLRSEGTVASATSDGTTECTRACQHALVCAREWVRGRMRGCVHACARAHVCAQCRLRYRCLCKSRESKPLPHSRTPVSAALPCVCSPQQAPGKDAPCTAGGSAWRCLHPRSTARARRCSAPPLAPGARTYRTPAAHAPLASRLQASRTRNGTAHPSQHAWPPASISSTRPQTAQFCILTGTVIAADTGMRIRTCMHEAHNG